jgi:ParB family chromosome partitioning protein
MGRKSAHPSHVITHENYLISFITVGKRARKDTGDLAKLAESISGLGLFNPLTLNPRGELVAGYRRLQAVKLLGWVTVPARIVETLDDAVKCLKAERDENTCRKDLSPTEAFEQGRTIEAMERREAKKRQGRAGEQRSGKLPERSRGQTRDKVAAAVGMGGKTYEKLKAVVEAAEADPERYGDLPAKMDATSVHAAHTELKARREPPAEPQDDVSCWSFLQQQTSTLILLAKDYDKLVNTWWPDHDRKAKVLAWAGDARKVLDRIEHVTRPKAAMLRARSIAAPGDPRGGSRSGRQAAE